MTVGKKIAAGFCLAVAAIAAIGGTSYHSTQQLVATAESVSQAEYVLKNMEATISALKDLESGRRGFVLTGDEAYLAPYLTALGSIDDLMTTLRKLTAANERQQHRLDALARLIGETKHLSKEIIELRRAGGLVAAQPMVASGRFKVIMDETRRWIREMEEEETQRMRKREEISRAAVTRSRRVIAFGGLASALLLAIVGWLITKNIAGPLAEVTAAAEKIADGDLDIVFSEVPRDDEVGTLVKTFERMCISLTVLAGRARQIAEGDLTAQIQPRSERDVLGNAFAGMVSELRRLMQELRDAAKVLAHSASEIMASTSQLAASAAETATAVTETTATVEEMKQASQVSSGKAKEVAAESQRAAEVANGGRTALGQTIEGMGQIRLQMGAIAESILSLSAQSHAIGEIVTTVDDLAAQSKLLAVNASIEASKAGDEGKGFAVVALEVRSLAEQSKKATTQVRGILNDIQKATANAVLATEEGGKAVEAGVTRTASSGESIRALAESIAAAAQASSQIAATSQQQFVGLDQVGLAMENIKSASTQTVASTRQAESAAQRLHEIGQKLQQLFERFKT